MTEHLNCTAQTPMPVEQIKAPAYCPNTDKYWEITRYLESLEKWKAEAMEIHTRNIVAIEHNAKQAKIVGEFLKSLGLTGYSERDTHSRSRYPKQIHHDAGYIADLRRLYVVFDGHESAFRECIERKKRADELFQKLECVKKENEQKRVEEQKKSESFIELGKMAARRGVDVDNWYDMVDHLRKQCKYLDLAIAMEQVRCDWNDGCGPVESALGRFTAESGQDKEIEEDIASRCEDFGDGRTFRDSEWGYGTLYGMVDDALMADFNIAREHYKRLFEGE